MRGIEGSGLPDDGIEASERNQFSQGLQVIAGPLRGLIALTALGDQAFDFPPLVQRYPETETIAQKIRVGTLFRKWLSQDIKRPLVSSIMMARSH